MGLRIVGKELPELLGDGYLVYLLHHQSPLIVQAAVECCSNSARNSRMLIPALVKHLPNAMLRTQVVEALNWFEPSDLWDVLYQFTEEIVGSPTAANTFTKFSGHSHDKREALSGVLKMVESGNFPLEDKLEMLLHLVDALMVSPRPTAEAGGETHVLQYLFGKDDVMEELVVDGLLSLVSTHDLMLRWLSLIDFFGV